MRAGKRDGVDASALENPAVERASLVRLFLGRRCVGLVTPKTAGRERRYKGRNGVADIGRHQDDEPEAAYLFAQPSHVHREKAERHERITEEISHLEKKACDGPLC